MRPSARPPRIVHGLRMELDEAISGIVAQVIEEVVGILAGGVRADERRGRSFGNVALFCGGGNHSGLRGLPGGGRSRSQLGLRRSHFSDPVL